MVFTEGGPQVPPSNLETTIPAETMTGLEFLSKEALAKIQKVANERGTEAAAAEARGLMDA